MTVSDQSPAGSIAWARSPDVLWRVATDRVLVRRVGGGGLDLLGLRAAALVWAALDEPANIADLCAHIVEVDGSASDETLQSALDMLYSAGLVTPQGRG